MCILFKYKIIIIYKVVNRFLKRQIFNILLNGNRSSSTGVSKKRIILNQFSSSNKILKF